MEKMEKPAPNINRREFLAGATAALTVPTGAGARLHDGNPPLEDEKYIKETGLEVTLGPEKIAPPDLEDMLEQAKDVIENFNQNNNSGPKYEFVEESGEISFNDFNSLYSFVFSVMSDDGVVKPVEFEILDTDFLNPEKQSGLQINLEYFLTHFAVLP